MAVGVSIVAALAKYVPANNNCVAHRDQLDHIILSKWACGPESHVSVVNRGNSIRRWQIASHPEEASKHFDLEPYLLLPRGKWLRQGVNGILGRSEYLEWRRDPSALYYLKTRATNKLHNRSLLALGYQGRRLLHDYRA
jgi:hypothetical protein